MATFVDQLNKFNGSNFKILILILGLELILGS